MADFDQDRAAAALMAALVESARPLKDEDREFLGADDIVLERAATQEMLGGHLNRAWHVGVTECLERISELETELQRVRSDLAASEEAVALSERKEDSLNTAMRQVREIVHSALRN